MSNASREIRRAIVLLGAVALVAAAQHQKINENEVIRYDRQEITVSDFPAEGYIVDIGGGGEAVIGQLKPKQTIAVDLSKRELEEAPPGPLKIVMDARDLKFLDNAIPTVTAFYCLMYVAETDHPKVFSEAYRVLAPGGRLLIWEATTPHKEGEKKWAIFPITVNLPAEQVKTGYGVPLGGQPHDSAYFARLATEAGFHTIATQEDRHHFFLEFQKAPSAVPARGPE
jgi:ubiquinone/menaquinone biosynthesis C-methylase UbiE